MARVLRKARVGLGSQELIQILTDHQWLGPFKSSQCLCGVQTSEHGDANKLAGHNQHVANVILEGV